MAPVRRAVIDIGTNSVKLLVAEVAGREVRPLLEQSHQTRLGQGFYDSYHLQPGPIADTAAAVADFAARARAQQATSIRVIATSAARDAVNARDLLSAVEQATRLRVQVISGEQEADWTFQGATTNPALATAPLVLLDIGGGSTEAIVGQGREVFFRASFQLGTLRLLERLKPSDPPKAQELAACRKWLADYWQREIAPKLQPALDCKPVAAAAGGNAPVAPPQIKNLNLKIKNPLLVGTGGTASILGGMEARLEQFDRDRVEATRLSRERLRWHVERLWGLPLAERKTITGLPPNRADVILTGVTIYELWLEQLGFGELRLSTRGLRFAAVLATSHLS